MIVNRANLDALFEGFNTRFNASFEGATSYVDSVAMTVPSSARQENYAWLGAMPGFREWNGPRVVQNLTMQTYALKNLPFESTISVPTDDIADDQYGVFGPMFSEMGRRAKTHPDELLFALMKDAFSTLCYDGQNFFDADHPVGDSGAQVSVANTDGGSGAAWFLLDTSRAILPFIWQLRKPYLLIRKDDPRDDRFLPFHRLLDEIHQRYGRPFFVAETSHFGEGRARWTCARPLWRRLCTGPTALAKTSRSCCSRRACAAAAATRAACSSCSCRICSRSILS